MYKERGLSAVKKKTRRADTPTKKRIAETAKTLFSQKGYLGTSIEDIVSASDSSKGNLYHHFKNKEGLFLYLINEQVDQWLEQWVAKKTRYTSFTDTLYGLAEHVALDLKNPLSQAADEFSGSETADPEVIAEIVAAIQKQREVFLQILQEGIREGHIRPDYELEDLSVILYALLGGLSAARYDCELDRLIKLHRTAITVFLQGISAK